MAKFLQKAQQVQKPKKLPLVGFRCLLLKDSPADIKDTLKDPDNAKRYELKPELGVEGALFIPAPSQKPPSWFEFVQDGVDDEIDVLLNRTNAAVLLIRVDGRILAFTFGFGRNLINPFQVVQDFGIKTALNSLRHSSLRSIDSFTLEDKPVQKRTQASTASRLEQFGIDISRDILRAVTGLPRRLKDFERVSGSDATFAFSKRIQMSSLGATAKLILSYYSAEHYKKHFDWVDNIKRINDPQLIESLNAILINDLQKECATSAHLAPPTLVDWETIEGFSYTRRKDEKSSEMSIADYLSTLDSEDITLDRLKSDRVFVHKDGEASTEHWSVYKCLVFEHSDGNHIRVMQPTFPVYSTMTR